MFVHQSHIIYIIGPTTEFQFTVVLIDLRSIELYLTRAFYIAWLYQEDVTSIGYEGVYRRRTDCKRVRRRIE